MKKQNIFMVTGLPRSMTGWLSNLFTTDKSICWHDVRFEEALTVSPKSVGFSGPELVAQFDDIQAQFPDTPWLVVLRNADDAKTAFKQAAGDLLPQDDVVDKFWAERCHAISKICSHPNVATVKFDELGTESIARRIWGYLLPQIEFDVERWKMLCKLNIQQKIKWRY